MVNSIDTDGVKQGFDLEMLEAVCNVVNVPVIASGGAGCISDFTKLFKTLPKVDAGLAASIFHFGEVKISDLKNTSVNDEVRLLFRPILHTCHNNNCQYSLVVWYNLNSILWLQYY